MRLRLFACLFFCLSCGPDPAPPDPCDGVSLPPCPPACADGAFGQCGEACAPEGAACGNEIGDGRTCTAGKWGCSVHPPLGMGCNLVCRRG